MSTNKRNQTIVLEDGRQLGFAEYGAPTGRPTFHFHGSASSRLEHPAPENMLCEMDIRFISVDRPGHGLSDFQSRRALLDWPRDVCQLADHLKVSRFYVMGYSAGGPHALACAHQLPDRVIAGATVSGVAPMDRPGAYKGLPLPNQVLARSARWAPWLTRLVRWAVRGMAMGDTEKAARQLMRSIPDADKAVLDAPQHAEALVSSIREGLRLGSRGVAQDDILINQDWGFDLSGVRPRIDIWHGDADVNVPVHAARYMGDILENVRMTLLPGAGHFLIMDRWQEILLALA